MKILSTLRSLRVLIVIALAGLVSACGGTKVLKEPLAMQKVAPLAAASGDQLDVTLEWVIIRDGPGTWARDADWDEYLLRVVNKSDHDIEISSIVLVDAMDSDVMPERDRKRLVKSSKKVARRFKEEDIEIKAGMSGLGLFAAGSAATVVGVGAVMSGLFSGLFMNPVSAGTSALMNLAVIGPAIATRGVVRGVNNSKVNKEILRRQSELPMMLSSEAYADVTAAETETAGIEYEVNETDTATETLTANQTEKLTNNLLVVFFPISPSPQSLKLVYNNGSGPKELVLDTRAALQGLHLTALESAVAANESPEEPAIKN